MIWLSGLSQLVAMALTFALPPLQGGFEGRVVTESGSPLREAAVLLVSKGRPDIEAENLVATDENGMFHLKRIPDALFVQEPGYLPLLYRVDGNDHAPLVVMNKVAPEAKVPLPSCPNPGSGQRLLFVGSEKKIITWEKLRIQGDPGLMEISYPSKRQEKMTIASGGIYQGYPRIDVLAYTDAIAARVLDGGKDISGTTVAGKRWRWAFLNGFHIEYYDVSPDVAERFDSLIGNMCTIEQAASSH
jgi:hypothetical protein